MIKKKVKQVILFLFTIYLFIYYIIYLHILYNNNNINTFLYFLIFILKIKDNKRNILNLQNNNNDEYYNIKKRKINNKQQNLLLSIDIEIWNMINEYIESSDRYNMKLVNKKFNNISIILSGIKIYNFKYHLSFIYFVDLFFYF